MDTQLVSIVQHVATYLCSYVRSFDTCILLRCLLIASWFPKVTSLPLAAHASEGEACPQKSFEI